MAGSTLPRSSTLWHIVHAMVPFPAGSREAQRCALASHGACATCSCAQGVGHPVGRSELLRSRIGPDALFEFSASVVPRAPTRLPWRCLVIPPRFGDSAGPTRADLSGRGLTHRAPTRKTCKGLGHSRHPKLGHCVRRHPASRELSSPARSAKASAREQPAQTRRNAYV